MLRALVERCLAWRFLVLAAAVGVAALGVRAALELPIDAVPDLTNVQVQVLTSAPTLGPLDLERTVTAPIERALSGLTGMVELRSVSRAGISVVTAVFGDDVDLAVARQRVRERVDAARDAIPVGIGAPELGPLSSGLGEIFQFEVRGEPACAPGAPDTAACWAPMELRTVLDHFVAYRLREVPGVIEVNSFGGELETFEVHVDPERLAAHGLALGEVYAALEASQGTAGGGALARGGEQVLVRAEGRLVSADDVAAVRVATRAGGVAVRVADLGTVARAPMPRQGAVTRDGRGEIVSGIVMMTLGANGREVVTAVKERLRALAPALPAGVTLVPFYDRGELVDHTVATVATNLAEGALFVVAILFLFLGTARGGLVVGLAIPFSLLVAFIGMDLVGLSGNLMSLGAVDFGLVVDGSIIVVENAVVHLSRAASGQGRPLTYAEAARAVLGSTLEVRRAAVFGELIVVLVYVPILTLSGVEGRMFAPMAATVLFALGGAFVASLTFVPVLTATWLRGPGRHAEPWVVRALGRLYAPALDRAMRHPRLLALGALALVTLAGWRLGGLGVEFVPRLDEGTLAVQLLRLPSVSLAEAVAGATRFEALALSFPEVEAAVCKTGRAEIATDPMGVEISDCYLALAPPERWPSGGTQEELVARLEARFTAALPGLGFSFSQPIALRMSELLSGSRSDVTLTVHGDDLGVLARTSAALQRVLAAVPGAADVRGESLAGVPTLEIRVRPREAAREGLAVRDVLDVVDALGGRPVGEVWPDDGLPTRAVPLRVRLDGASRADPEAIAGLPVRGDAGAQVPLAQVAEFALVDQPASLSREAIARKTAIEVNIRGRDLAGFVAEAEARVARDAPPPPGYTLSWGGAFEDLEAATARLAIAVPLALGAILLLLYLAFGALAPALLVFVNVPAAAVGGVFLLEARGMPLSISAAVGFIALFGVAVLNGVVLVAAAQELRAAGRSARDAAREAAARRLRAVLMTAAVAALGFLPMALSTSAGAEVQRPVATVVIGGLLSATLLTLFVLPTLYAALFGRAAQSYRGEL